MTVNISGIISSLRSAWGDVNPLAAGASFSMYDFLEDRVRMLEEEINGLERQLSDAQVALRTCAPNRLMARCEGSI